MIAARLHHRPARRRWLLAAGLLALFLATRIGLVVRQSLWVDELFSLAMATGHSVEHHPDISIPSLGDYVEAPDPLPPSAYARYLRHDTPPTGPGRVARAVLLSDTNPPLYYLTLWGWTRLLGTSDASVRGLSLACGLACLPLLWSVGRFLGGTRAAALACLLFAIEPFSVYYSTEGRMYPLLWFFVASFLALSYRLVSRGVGLWALAGWIATGAGSLLVHYFAAPVWAAVLLCLVLRPGRFTRRWQGAGIVATLLLILPWYVHLPESLAGWRVTGDWLTVRPPRFRFLFDLLRLPWRPFSTHSHWGGPHWVEALAAAGFAMTFLLALRRAGRGWLAPKYRPIWLPVLSTCVALVVFDFLRGTYTMAVPRYTAAALPSAYLMAGLMLARIGRHARYVPVALIVFTATFTVVGNHGKKSRVGQPYDELGRRAAREIGRGELLIVHSIPIGACGVARALVAAGADEVELVPWTPVLGLRRVPDDIDRLTTGRGRVFLARVHSMHMEADQEVELARRRLEVRRWPLQGISLTEYGPEVMRATRDGETAGPGPGGRDGRRARVKSMTGTIGQFHELPGGDGR